MNILEKYNFTFVDVETPNFSNSAISSIALIHITKDGEIINKYTYVNPEQHFDNFNIELTGITPQMAKDAPTFDLVWKEISKYFEDSIIVAHNTRFDLGVLHKCFNTYGIQPLTMNYMCTVDLSKKYIVSINHKLNTLCDLLNIKLVHHQADSDTNACMQIFMHIHNQVELDETEIKTYVPKRR